MKLLAKLIFCILLLFAGEVKAQYVTITDSVFLIWLNQNIPLAMNGNQLDTNSIHVLNTQYIALSDSSSFDISPIMYFDSLQHLACEGPISNFTKFPSMLKSITLSGNNLTSIPQLPAALTQFFIANCPFISLPNLPSTLIELICNNNNLSSLPSLPISLKIIWCNNNNLSNLPNLPDSLNTLICYYNNLTNLPNLPNSLEDLRCNNNNISSLPNLPNSLLGLHCASNNLTNLPQIPPFLRTLCIDSNNINYLPILPDTLGGLSLVHTSITNLPNPLPVYLQALYFDYTNVSELPPLPQYLSELSFNHCSISQLPPLNSYLRKLSFDYNLVSQLPTLPWALERLSFTKNNIANIPNFNFNLQYLYCDSNQISCFPAFKEGMYFLNILGNPNTCIPNYISTMDSIMLSYPICIENDVISNPNNCLGSSFIGNVFIDNNNDCQKSDEPTLNNVIAKIIDGNQNISGLTTSNAEGNFYFPNAIYGYTILIDTTNFPFQTSCNNPGIDTLISNVPNGQMIDLSFGFDCPENFDLSIQSIVNNGIVFPGQTHSLIILTGETSKWFGFECFSDLSGILNITAVGPIQFEGVPPTAITPSVNGFIYSYNVSDFTTVTDNSFELNFLVDTTAQSDDNITIYAEILSNDNESNISNNSMVFNYQVVNSFDPNLKEVYPQQVLPGYDDYFTYTIHFQNLGTAPAFNIRIADTLSNNLDVETFQVINYSDPNTITINNNILQVRFPNIMLPDSASNPEGSKGFIQYKIKPKSGLAVDSTIKNTAYIYFDYNPAVVTNTAITEYVETLDIAAVETESSFNIFPNPSNGQITITTDLKMNGEIKIQLFDLSGKELEIDENENTNSSNWKITLNENSGFYILQIIDSEGNVFKKKIVLN